MAVVESSEKHRTLQVQREDDVRWILIRAHGRLFVSEADRVRERAAQSGLGGAGKTFMKVSFFFLSAAKLILQSCSLVLTQKQVIKLEILKECISPFMQAF